MKTVKPWLSVVSDNSSKKQSLENWLKEHLQRRPVDLEIVTEAKDMLFRKFLGFHGLYVLGERQGRLIYQFGSAKHGHLTCVGREANMWSAAVDAPHNVRIDVAMLFGDLAVPANDCGLPSEVTFGSYGEDHKQFRFWTNSGAKLINVAWQIGQQIS